MATTEFQTEIENGPLFNNAVTITMIADDTGVKLWGPVVLADGAVQAMPHAASTTTASDKNVIGVCVRMPRDGNATVADTSVIEVCLHGICKVKVNDANVSLNDSLVTHTTAGEAAVKAAFTISAAYAEAEIEAALNGVRAVFAIALSTVSSGADSIIACFVNITPYPGAA
jgi:hypothetical protein